MSETCGSTETRSGEPCGFPSRENCPHHTSGLSDVKQRACELLRTGEHQRVEVAAACGVSSRTLRRWVNKHEELQEAAEEGDRAQYEAISDAWFQRLREGDHTAAEIIFYLKNKRPDLWRDRRELEHSGEIDTGGETHVYLPDNSRDDLPEQLRRRVGAARGNGKK